jgi:predicted MFS family arabinose efflux permease
MFNRENARFFIYLGTLLVILSLASYSLASGFWSMFMVRILHGLAFVILGTALMTITVEFIPRDRSAQVFGLLAIIILIPNTIIPPILPSMDRWLGGFTRMLIFFAVITILVFPLIRGAVGGRVTPDLSVGKNQSERLRILEDFKDIRIPLILMAMLLLYCSHALVFFFLDGYGKSLGIAGTGFFLTLASLSEIGVRVGAGSLFDRMDKSRLLSWTMTGLALGYAVLAHVPGRLSFFAAGALLGLGWGIAMPVFNGLMFDISKPRFVAFNSNLGLQMFQGGFFIGPFIGGAVAARYGFTSLFHLCAAMSLLSAFLTFLIGGKKST